MLISFKRIFSLSFFVQAKIPVPALYSTERKTTPSLSENLTTHSTFRVAETYVSR